MTDAVEDDDAVDDDDGDGADDGFVETDAVDDDDDGDDDGDGDGALDNLSIGISYPDRLLMLSCEGVRDATIPSWLVPLLSRITFLPSRMLLLLLLDDKGCSLG